MFIVYVLVSLKTGKPYVGVTSKKPTERLKEHNEGHNQWTKGQRPLKLVYYEQYICKEDAYLRESFLKSGIGNRLIKIIIKEFA